MGAGIPERVNRALQYIPSVANFRENPSRSSPCPDGSAPFFHIVQRAPDLSDGGFHLPCTQEGLYHFGPPLSSAACEAVFLGDAEDCRLTDSKKIATNLFVNRGHASALQVKRVLVYPGGNNTHLSASLDEVLAQCEVCQAVDKAPHAPAAGTSTAATFDEKLEADLLFPDDIIALHGTDVIPKYSLSIPARTQNPQEVRGAFCSPAIGVFGPPMSIQMDEGGEWENELLAALRCERRIKLYLGVGEHAWILERRNGIARGICSRLGGGAIDSQANRSSRRYSGPGDSHLGGEAFPPTRWSLDRIQWISVCGRIGMRV